ncbi:hypothetical protein DFP72DRAFT_1082608 [Ephemerocybe angulata]|uniref:MYND-type domain-containing protein n=1 Tax=Ephemerocybe angulata TaxID=980116 RepID=A0A8H6H7Z9_9AGAR|nr:hypothetical protein DFP72DRAFT_1082608 [Tulosesus angulatus]
MVRNLPVESCIGIILSSPAPNLGEDPTPNTLRTAAHVRQAIQDIGDSTTHLPNSTVEKICLHLCLWVDYLLLANHSPSDTHSRGLHVNTADSILLSITVLFHKSFPEARAAILSMLLRSLALSWYSARDPVAEKALANSGSGHPPPGPLRTTIRLFQIPHSQPALYRTLDLSADLSSQMVTVVFDRIRFLAGQSAPTDTDPEQALATLNLIKDAVVFVAYLMKKTETCKILLEKKALATALEVSIKAITTFRRFLLLPDDNRMYTIAAGFADSFYRATFSTSYPMELLVQLIHGGILHLVNYTLSLGYHDPKVLTISEAILKYIGLHSWNDQVNRAILDFNSPNFDYIPGHGVLFNWYIGLSIELDCGVRPIGSLAPCYYLKCPNVGGTRERFLCSSCNRVAYCSKECVRLDRGDMHGSECAQMLEAVTLEASQGYEVSFLSKEIQSSIIAKVAEYFSQTLFPGNLPPTALESRSIPCCDMRTIPTAFFHRPIQCYLKESSQYTPLQLQTRRYSYIKKSEQECLRLIEFIFPLGCKSVVTLALVELNDLRYTIRHSFSFTIPRSLIPYPNAKARPLYLIPAKGPGLPLFPGISLTRT